MLEFMAVIDHHEGYITWEEYITNKKILANNQTSGEKNMLPTAVREGIGLLQGLLICGRCGRRLSIRYKGKNSILTLYECNWKKEVGSR